MNEDPYPSTHVGEALKTKKIVRITELILPFLLATLIIYAGKFIAGEDPILNQVVVWISNIVMLGVV